MSFCASLSSAGVVQLRAHSEPFAIFLLSVLEKPPLVAFYYSQIRQLNVILFNFMFVQCFVMFTIASC